MNMERHLPAVGAGPEAIASLADMQFPDFSEAEIARIARLVSSEGFCRLDGVVADAALADARGQAGAAVMANGGEYVAFAGQAGFSGYLLSDIHADPAFGAFLAGLYRATTGREAPRPHVHQVLRCLQGRTARRHAGYLHYDSYVVTILVPLAVPPNGPTGDLLLVPERRGIRHSYAANVADKLLLDRGPMQRWLWRRIAAGRIPALRLRMEPGALYIFWGYRSLHANEPSEPSGLRATLLYHYGNPHDDRPKWRWRRRR